MNRIFDVIVIGAGHAGCEAALTAAKMGCSVMIITINLNNIAFMPCNPSVGGPGKGHLVREIDALGGVMGRVTDETHIQMRELNTQKGPAVRALRAQTDKRRYQEVMQRLIELEENITLRQGEVIAVEQHTSYWDILLATGVTFRAKTVIFATGTFLRGIVHLGNHNYPSGPLGQHPSVKLSENLEKVGLQLRRFKTGTPARIRWRSLHFDRMVEQPGDELTHGFSFWNEWRNRSNVPCWLTYTNEETHKIIKENLHRAALYCGSIKGVGPRYCPSIESKLVRFPDKDRHQVFIEPEGLQTDEAYVAGLSTSLPEDVQEEFLRTIPGLEDVEIVRPGYAIEYDVIESGQLSASLELHKLPGIFSAGQFNGSSGYEEAAAQGIIAGINAANKVKGNEPLILRRDEAYIGVLIDDLINKDSDEPYRIMTSRAEFRLSLRQENADQRLTDYGYKYGIIKDHEYQQFIEKRELISDELRRMEETTVDASKFVDGERSFITIANLLRRTEIDPERVIVEYQEGKVYPTGVKENLINTLRYQGYIKREEEMANRLKKAEEKRIPPDIDYKIIPNLSAEAKEKLEKIRPMSMGQVTRISGVSPADQCALLFFIQKKVKKND